MILQSKVLVIGFRNDFVIANPRSISSPSNYEFRRLLLSKLVPIKAGILSEASTD